MSNPYNPASPASSSTSHPSPHLQPVTRSRTLFYLSIRDSSSTSYSRRGPRNGSAQYGDTIDVADDEHEGLIGGNKALRPKWSVYTLCSLRVGADRLKGRHE